MVVFYSLLTSSFVAEGGPVLGIIHLDHCEGCGMECWDCWWSCLSLAVGILTYFKRERPEFIFSSYCWTPGRSHMLCGLCRFQSDDVTWILSLQGNCRRWYTGKHKACNHACLSGSVTFSSKHLSPAQKPGTSKSCCMRVEPEVHEGRLLCKDLLVCNKYIILAVFFLVTMQVANAIFVYTKDWLGQT